MTERTCPECQSTNVAEYLYGYPSDEAAEAANRGEVILGGCMPPFIEPAPQLRCGDCDHEWRHDGQAIDPWYRGEPIRLDSPDR
jgi:hypothetical protein